jgi:hypothetical protein
MDALVIRRVMLLAQQDGVGRQELVQAAGRVVQRGGGDGATGTHQTHQQHRGEAAIHLRMLHAGNAAMADSIIMLRW